MKRYSQGLALIVGCALVVWVIWAITNDHWIFHPLGDCQGAHCKGYQFWSGLAGTVLFTSGLYSGLYVVFRKHNCHVKGCWRIGRHPVAGTTYVVCRSHHPDDKPTKQTVHDAHHRYLADKEKERADVAKRTTRQRKGSTGGTK